jgi:hypothetical protein
MNPLKAFLINCSEGQVFSGQLNLPFVLVQDKENKN